MVSEGGRLEVLKAPILYWKLIEERLLFREYRECFRGDRGYREGIAADAAMSIYGESA